MNPDPEKSTFLQIHLDNGESPKTTESDKPKFMDRFKHLFSRKWDSFSKSKNNFINFPQVSSNIRKNLSNFGSNIRAFLWQYSRGLTLTLVTVIRFAIVCGIVATSNAVYESEMQRVHVDKQLYVGQDCRKQFDAETSKNVAELQEYDKFLRKNPQLREASNNREQEEQRFEDTLNEGPRYDRKHVDWIFALFGLYMVGLFVSGILLGRRNAVSIPVIGILLAIQLLIELSLFFTAIYTFISPPIDQCPDV